MFSARKNLGRVWAVQEQKLAALLCSELAITGPFSRDEMMESSGGTLPEVAGGVQAKRGARLRMANQWLRTKHFLALPILIPVPAKALSQVTLIVFFNIILF